MKHVHLSFGLTLGEAKAVVTSHPTYRAWAEANEPLHDAVLRALEASTEPDSP